MKYLIWKHDPCPEGGWHIVGSDNTEEGAITKAKAYHALQLKDVEDCGVITCYDEVMVTGAQVFKEVVPEDILSRRSCPVCWGIPEEKTGCQTCSGVGWVRGENEQNERNVK